MQCLLPACPHRLSRHLLRGARYSKCWLGWAQLKRLGPSPILPCVQVAAELGKPLVLEEFGKNSGEGNITSVRDPWFGLVQGAVDASLQSGGPLRGALFWQWDGETGPRIDVGSNIREVRGVGQMRVRSMRIRFQGYLTRQILPLMVALLAPLPPVQYDTTFTHHISPFAHKLAGQPRQTVPGCAMRGSSAAGAQPASGAFGGDGLNTGLQGANSQSAGRKLLQRQG